MRTSLLLAAILVVPRVQAAPVDYVRDIKPVLKERCYACHGSLAQKAGLRLDAGTLILKGGKHGPAIRRGDPADSQLIDRLTRNPAEEGGRMPPEGSPLTAEQIAKFRQWIAEGASFPASEKPEADPRLHWSFRPVGRPPTPSVRNQQLVHNPIDAFLAVQWDKRGLTPVGQADKATLLRRVYFDLIGLPPTRAELHAFLADHSSDAYEKVVDRLLDSPAYGERWGRHWMDVWRYSDWYGRRAVPDVLNSYAMIFRWRDWIVRSLNEDRGYDWMLQQMIAADELNPADDANLVATGYIARNFYRWNYNQWMKDLVEHTGKAFLGLTMNCCHCHDHKYDPITHHDYFAFRAFFEPLEMRHDRVPGEPDAGVYPKYDYAKAYGPIQSGMIRVYDEKLDAKTFMYTGGDTRQVIAGKPPVTPAGPAFLNGDKLKFEAVTLPVTSWYPGLKEFAQRDEVAASEAAIATASGALAAARKTAALFERAAFIAGASVWAKQEKTLWASRLAKAKFAAAQSNLVSVTARIAADKVRYLGAPGNADELSRKASKAERQAALDAAIVAHLQAELNLVTARRDLKSKAKLPQLEKVVTTTQQALVSARTVLAGDKTSYSPLGPVYAAKTSTGRRAALARWLVSRDNPLTPRVAVNHIWGWHFGRPVAESTHDLGRNGKRPSHPDLLNWLAAEFIENRWSIKHLNRLIVTSNAYRMQSQPPADHSGRAADPDNKLWWHFATQRLEAEQVRDAMLHLSGELDPAIGGRELPQEQGLTSKRRSLYYATHGETRMEFLDLFDAADPCECYRRTSSVRPQQALALANSEFAARQGRVLAHKLWASLPAAAKSDSEFIRAAFEQLLSRPPSAGEQSASLAFLARQLSLLQTARKLPSVPMDGSLPSDEPATRGRENFVQVLLNHSDFVTIR